MPHLFCKEREKGGAFTVSDGPEPRALFGVEQGGFYFHPSDEDLSQGTPVKEKVYSRNKIMLSDT